MEFQINGKTCGIKFNNYAIEQMSKVKGDPKMLLNFLGAATYCGYRGWCFAKQVEPELTFEEITDFVDASVESEECKKIVVDISALYTDSWQFKKLIKSKVREGDADGEGEKKSEG